MKRWLRLAYHWLESFCRALYGDAAYLEAEEQAWKKNLPSLMTGSEKRHGKKRRELIRS